MIKILNHIFLQNIHGYITSYKCDMYSICSYTSVSNICGEFTVPINRLITGILFICPIQEDWWSWFPSLVPFTQAYSLFCRSDCGQALHVHIRNLLGSRFKTTDSSQKPCVNISFSHNFINVYRASFILRRHVKYHGKNLVRITLGSSAQRSGSHFGSKANFGCICHGESNQSYFL